MLIKVLIHVTHRSLFRTKANLRRVLCVAPFGKEREVWRERLVDLLLRQPISREIVVLVQLAEGLLLDALPIDVGLILNHSLFDGVGPFHSSVLHHLLGLPDRIADDLFEVDVELPKLKNLCPLFFC